MRAHSDVKSQAGVAVIAKDVGRKVGGHDSYRVGSANLTVKSYFDDTKVVTWF